MERVAGSIEGEARATRPGGATDRRGETHRQRQCTPLTYSSAGAPLARFPAAPPLTVRAAALAPAALVAALAATLAAAAALAAALVPALPAVPAHAA